MLFGLGFSFFDNDICHRDIRLSGFLYLGLVGLLFLVDLKLAVLPFHEELNIGSFEKGLHSSLVAFVLRVLSLLVKFNCLLNITEIFTEYRSRSSTTVSFLRDYFYVSNYRSKIFPQI